MAARLALPTAQAECQQAPQAAMAMSRQRDSALVTATVDGVEGITEAVMIPAIERVLRIVARATRYVSLRIGARHRPRREQRGPRPLTNRQLSVQKSCSDGEPGD